LKYRVKKVISSNVLLLSLTGSMLVLTFGRAILRKKGTNSIGEPLLA
jgi:hypothetical protein